MKALITGASSGIGYEMAKYLDKLGIDLILVARREDRLVKLKKELHVNVKIITMDLSIKNNANRLYDRCKNEGINILINNAGFGLFGDFTLTSLEKEMEMIDLNVITPHILTKLFLKDFIKKNEGYILNVCSSAGFMAGPKLNTYYATKNYLLKLTMAINEEIRRSKKNVKISALCPGPVNTEFNDVAKGSFTIKGIKSDYVAKLAIDKMFKGKMIIIPTFKMKLAIFATRFMPYRWQLKTNYNIQNAKINNKKEN